MIATLLGAWALFAGMALIVLGYGLQSSLLGRRSPSKRRASKAEPKTDNGATLSPPDSKTARASRATPGTCPGGSRGRPSLPDG